MVRVGARFIEVELATRGSYDGHPCTEMSGSLSYVEGH